MQERSDQFGSFGDLRRPKAPLKKRATLYALVFLVAALLPAGYLGWSDLYTNVLEGRPPDISVPNPPAGLGPERLVIGIDLSDREAGLSSVVIRAEQQGVIRELLRKDYSEPLNNDHVDLMLDGRKSGLKEGDVLVVITTLDRASWKNRRELSLPLRVDYSPPVIGAVRQELSVVAGGSGIIFYKVSDNDNTFSGIRIGSNFFPGFSAAKLDHVFAQTPNLQFALYSIPADEQSDRRIVKIVARDDVGNVSTEEAACDVKRSDSGERSVQVPASLVKEKADQLLDRYLQLQVNFLSRQQPNLPKGADNPADVAARFRALAFDYQALLEQQLQPLFQRPKAMRLWEGPFIRPTGQAITANFADRLHYQVEGVDVAGVKLSNGITFSQPKAVPVTAANTGIVIFADDLGVYGKTVILDHGFGVSTLYSNLSSVSVVEGDRAQKGQALGVSGSTGLVDQEQIHFEIRLYGFPVRPNEWADPRWMAETIDRKAALVKRELGLKVMQPLE